MPLDQLLRGVWNWRWRLALATVLLLACGATLILRWPRHYVAQAMMAPAETTGVATSTLLSPAPILQGGLLDSRPAGNFAIYLDALRSPEAAAMLARETGLLDELTARRRAGPLGPLRRRLGWRIEADLDDAATWLEANFAATQGIATATVTLTLAHRDRNAALDMLRRLHALAEAKVRADLMEQTRRRITAIEARLAQESDLFRRNTLYELLASQQRASLVLGVDETVATRVVSAPMVEIRPSLPNRPLLLLLLALAVPVATLCGAICLVLLFGPEGPRANRFKEPWKWRTGCGRRRIETVR